MAGVGAMAAGGGGLIAAKTMPAAVARAPGTSAPGPRRTGAPDPKLVEAAHAFEELLVAQLLSQARRAARLVAERPRVPGTDVYESWQDEAAARAIVAGGGFGLADLLVRQLAPRRST